MKNNCPINDIKLYEASQESQLGANYFKKEFGSGWKMAFTKQANKLPIARTVSSGHTPCMDTAFMSSPLSRTEDNSIYHFNEPTYYTPQQGSSAAGTLIDHRCPLGESKRYFDDRFVDTRLSQSSLLPFSLFTIEEESGVQ